MRMPRFRLTVRRMMLAVLLLAAGFGGERMWRRYRASAEVVEGLDGMRLERLVPAERYRRDAEADGRKAGGAGADAPGGAAAAPDDERETAEHSASVTRTAAAAEVAKAEAHGRAAEPF